MLIHVPAGGRILILGEVNHDFARTAGACAQPMQLCEVASR
jgi:hypothetical protein